MAPIKQHNQFSAPAKGQAQHGVTMVEILVAIIILSIGFLGMASIQLMGAKNIAGSSFRTMATIYAYDMAERMRSNAEGVDNGAYNNLDFTQLAQQRCGNNCTPAQIAQRDAFEWSQAIKGGLTDGGLPQGGGAIVYNVATDTHTINVNWREAIRIDDDFPDANGELQQFELEVQL
ncbi:type IV pilus modification protein PilV [Halioxenophilus aromaticivorans]|uniref:Type IV pilus modification protein PilV n=1 Tax=Halioxenophilus aromaticivorans TaxID=1306992 RepID=A0AAV3TYC7_9ALTE